MTRQSFRRAHEDERLCDRVDIPSLRSAFAIRMGVGSLFPPLLSEDVDLPSKPLDQRAKRR